MFLFCFIPGFYILSGTLYALQYADVNWLSFALGYLLIMVNQLLENKFKESYTEETQSKKESILFIECVLFFIIIYFGIAHSIISGLLLICYSVLIQGQFLFKFYNSSNLAIVLVTLFKCLLLNSFGFYIHTGFIPFSLVIWTIPLLLPIGLTEYIRWKNLTPVLLRILLIFSFTLGFVFLYLKAGWYGLLLILTLPFIFLTWKQTKKIQLLRLFTASFLFLHFTIMLLSILT